MSNMPTWSVTHRLKLGGCRSGVTTAADFYKGQEKVHVRGGRSGQVGQTELSQLSVVNIKVWTDCWWYFPKPNQTRKVKNIPTPIVCRWRSNWAELLHLFSLLTLWLIMFIFAKKKDKADVTEPSFGSVSWLDCSSVLCKTDLKCAIFMFPPLALSFLPTVISSFRGNIISLSGWCKYKQEKWINWDSP